MALHIALVFEILASIICIHCIYGKKVKLDLHMVVTVLSILSLLEMANYYKISGIFSIGVYVILFIYSINKFKVKKTEALAGLLLYSIVLSCIQFIGMLLVSILVNLFIEPDLYVRNAIGNVLIFIVCWAILPKCKIDRIQKSLCGKSKFVGILFLFMVGIVTIMLIQGKVYYEVHIPTFLLVVFAIVLLLYAIISWHTERVEVERMEAEIDKITDSVKHYDSLITNIRLRQHELKNHMTAIFSAHYTYKTYEQLVKAQEDYCKKLMAENKYNNLLLLGDNVFSGYLYGKFQEAEDDGIEVKYKIGDPIENCDLPTYYRIEMLGILLDNAVEALKSATIKKMYVKVQRGTGGYEFSVSNPSPYVSYEEIKHWFQLGESSKGGNRGLGLYHLKELCDQWNCDVICQNEEMDQENWIVFTIRTKMKKD